MFTFLLSRISRIGGQYREYPMEAVDHTDGLRGSIILERTWLDLNLLPLVILERDI